MAPQMHTLNSALFKTCHTLETLGWHNDKEAKSLLQRAADQVAPLMYKHNWTVPVLAEFYPDQPNLLGLNHNHGSKIELRLRRPGDPTAFLPYENILGTLLHELCHCDIGPHNADFYKLLDKLTEECDQLMAKGQTGAAFGGTGRRVGDGMSRYIPMHVAKARALQAAEKRATVQQIMGGGGRLGGRADIARLCDPREMALAAAQRRRNDEVWCASGQQVIEIPDDSDPEVQIVEPPARSRAKRLPTRQNPAALAALRRAGQAG